MRSYTHSPTNIYQIDIGSYLHLQLLVVNESLKNPIGVYTQCGWFIINEIIGVYLCGKIVTLEIKINGNVYGFPIYILRKIRVNSHKFPNRKFSILSMEIHLESLGLQFQMYSYRKMIVRLQHYFQLRYNRNLMTNEKVSAVANSTIPTFFLLLSDFIWT